MYLSVHMCCGSHVGVRGQLAEVCSLLVLLGPVRFGTRHLYLLAYLAGLFFLLCICMYMCYINMYICTHICVYVCIYINGNNFHFLFPFESLFPSLKVPSTYSWL